MQKNYKILTPLCSLIRRCLVALRRIKAQWNAGEQTCFHIFFYLNTFPCKAKREYANLYVSHYVCHTAAIVVVAEVPAALLLLCYFQSPASRENLCQSTKLHAQIIHKYKRVLLSKRQAALHLRMYMCVCVYVCLPACLPACLVV